MQEEIDGEYYAVKILPGSQVRYIHPSKGYPGSREAVVLVESVQITCTLCKRASHNGDCAAVDGLKEVLELAEANQ
jgi:hypothetical protein